MNTTSDIRDYDLRGKLGRAKEDSIITALKQQGLDVAPATENEDKYHNIDAWVTKGNQRFSIQVKHREGGDDLIFELIKDVIKQTLGRDMKGEAQYYLLVNRNGEGKLYNLNYLRKFLDSMRRYGMEQFKANPRTRYWTGKEWEMKITVDNATGNFKLMAYVKPTAFEPVMQWKKLI